MKTLVQIAAAAASVGVLAAVLGMAAGTAGSQPSTKPASPVAAGAKPEKLAGDFAFTEGSTCDKEGNVFFIDQPNDRIMEWSVDGKLSVFLHPSGYSNGMSFDAKGNLISCADEHNQLWSIAPDKTVTVLLKDFNGKLLNGPNDVWIRPDGGMYLTDPLYPRTWWKERTAQSQQPGRYVYFLSPDHKTLTPVITDFTQPNGIIGTPDGKTLYVSDINGRKTWQYTIKDDGTLADKKSFADIGSDGMTIDSEGNVYTTGRTLGIFDKNGVRLDTIQLPKSSANVCFGGKDGHMLFICAGDSVYSLKMRTHGVGPQ
jgi:gluconolactonase